ncbi:hypothetical protein [Baaleninema simplex]|uniref:hypothetical protein n=1 Tax=Baaleninema simplex TaxID=2862350 RepID=UPI000345E479|nr:hypothetical protein [Baaleninema simplex]
MASLDVTFDIPAKIAEGLIKETLVRNGGVIQDNAGRVVMWLKEASNATGVTPQSGLQMLSGVEPTGVLKLALAAGNTIVTQQRLGAISAQVSQLQNMVTFATAGSMLTLGVSVLGFAVIYKKVKALEGRLQKVQESLEKIDEKIDLSFYANFRAALDLAQNAFSMAEQSNRRSSALQAINRFLEAEHVYTELTDKELERQSQISDEYLLTLCFAYLAETRCYLELGEYDTALRRFQEGKLQIRDRVEKYIDILLTSNPLMYLHPELKGITNLSRLTKIYQWKNPSLTENTVFEQFRDELPALGLCFDDWVKALPASVMEKSEIKKGFFGVSDEGRKAVFERLPQVIEEMESIVETNERYASYEWEVKLLKKAKIPFRQWEMLKPKEVAPEGASLICIEPPKPLAL